MCGSTKNCAGACVAFSGWIFCEIARLISWRRSLARRQATWDCLAGTNLNARFFLAAIGSTHLAKIGAGVMVNFADIGGLAGAERVF